jgi:hypothetical protein
MPKVRGNAPIFIVVAGVATAALGLVILTFAEPTGLYCFAIGVVLILVFIGIKTVELNSRD